VSQSSLSSISYPSLLFIIPTLNSSHLLPALYQSFVTQTFVLWRVIFVDGNSTSSHQEALQGLCSRDSRFSFISQSSHSHLIYGAMNDGLRHALPHEYVLFWGSDDRAHSIYSLQQIASLIASSSPTASITHFFFATQYFDAQSSGRPSRFPAGTFSVRQFRFLMFLGFVPPHQGTVFTPTSTSHLTYDESFTLAADLSYFLSTSLSKHSHIHSSVSTIVDIGSGGESSRRFLLRIKEVISAYIHAFGPLFWVPFLLRYFLRLLSLIPHLRLNLPQF